MSGNEDEDRRREAERRRGKQPVSDDDGGDDKSDSSSLGVNTDCSDSEIGFVPATQGLSRFYLGRAKSFTNLATESTTLPVKELGKEIVDVRTIERKTKRAEGFVERSFKDMTVESDEERPSKRRSTGGLTIPENTANKEGGGSASTAGGDPSAGKAGIPSQALPTSNKDANSDTDEDVKKKDEKNKTVDSTGQGSPSK